MEINNYKVFLEVTRFNSITKAAESLGYTQSGISHALKRLEAELELTLFERGRNGAQLTPQGKMILPYIRQVVNSMNSLDQVVSSINDLHEGTVNIATFSSISRQWLPDIISKFKRDYPDIELHFKEGGQEEIKEMYENRTADLVFATIDSEINCNWIPLLEDSFVAILPPDDPFEGDYYPLELFNNRTFIISSFGVDYELHNYLKEYNITPNITYSAQDDMTIIAMVEKSLGVSILPELVIRKYGVGIKSLPLKPDLRRTLGIGYSRGDLISPMARTFIEYAEAVILGKEIKRGTKS